MDKTFKNHTINQWFCPNLEVIRHFLISQQDKASDLERRKANFVPQNEDFRQTSQ